MMLPSRNWKPYALAALITVPLLIYAFATIFARYMGDDFCAYDQVHDWGISGYVIANYMLWSGRVLHNFSSALLRFMPSTDQALFAVSFLVIWWIGLFLLARLILNRRGLENANAWGALVASLLLLTTLTGSANIFHTIYWQMAIVTYLVPLVLLTYFAWLVLQDSLNAPVSLILCAVLPLIAGGYSEVFAPLQMGLILVAYFVYALQKPRFSPQFQRLLVGFIASFVIMVIVLVAPGNGIRQSDAFITPSLSKTITGAVSDTAVPLVISLDFSPFNCIALLILPALVAFYYDRREAAQARLYTLIVLLTILGASAGTSAVAYYATSNVLPARALINPQYVWLVGLTVCSYLFGLSLRRVGRKYTMPGWIMVAAIVLLVAAAVTSSWQALTTTQRLQVFAAEWDQRDAQIKAFRAAHPGSTDPVTVMFIPNRFDVDEIGPDPQSWVNQCADVYYHVASIVATPPQ